MIADFGTMLKPNRHFEKSEIFEKSSSVIGTVSGPRIFNRY